MKKSVLTIVALLTVFSVTVAGIGEENKKNSRPISIEKASDSHVNLLLESDDPGQLAVKVLDDKGRKVMENSIAYEGSFVQPFDMSGLKEGTYTFRVSGEDFDHAQDVFNSKLYKEDVFASLVEITPGQYRLTVLHDQVPVKVQVIDEQGRIRYNRTHVQRSNFTQDIKISNLDASELELVISGNKSVIRHTLD